MARDITVIQGRYELIDEENNHKKFWSVEQMSGDSFEIRWGRIGTAGQGPQIVTASEASKRIAEKTKKGYVLVKAFDVAHLPTVAKEAWIGSVSNLYAKETTAKAVQMEEDNEDLLNLFNQLR
jgi:predicted DNA-binding WGR domain protein